MQYILAGNPKLLATQAWADKRAARITSFDRSVKRALYWHLSLVLPHLPRPPRNRVFAYELARQRWIASFDKQYRKFARSSSSGMPHDPPSDGRDTARSKALEFIRNFAKPPANFPPTLASNNPNSDTFNLVRNNALPFPRNGFADELRIDHLDFMFTYGGEWLSLDTHEFETDIGFAIDSALAHDLTYTEDDFSRPFYTRNSPLRICEGFDFLLFDVSSINLILFVDYLTYLPKSRRSNSLVSKFQSFLTAWKQMPGNSLDVNKVINCPSYQAPTLVWKFFRKTINKVVGKLLEIDLNIAWHLEEYQTALTYLEANQLFWDCLQVARVEDREAIEDMILNVPEG